MINRGASTDLETQMWNHWLCDISAHARPNSTNDRCAGFLITVQHFYHYYYFAEIFFSTHRYSFSFLFCSHKKRNVDV